VQDPLRYMDTCGPRIEKTASGHPPLDAMASNIAHELVEVVSDPDATDNRAWEDVEGFENGDKCAVS
jgi:hypothetical protein